ncbi:MbnP family protein, partial [Spirosoma sp.]|uniref:MbnP family protein n=1 Tax=Spirosoma sp. TaxID=1899569 RepID=UPI003B3AAB8E
MKNTITLGLLSVIILTLIVFSCNTFDPIYNAPLPGKIKLVIDNVAGTSDLKLDSATYQNAAGESFSVSRFNYFISNIRLRKADGSDYVVPQDSSYFLI